jgi:hypothetical protein
MIMADIFHFHPNRGQKLAEVRTAAAKGVPAKELPHTERIGRLRPLIFLLILTAAVLFLLAELARAGGPRYVAGASYFDSSVKGTPITWSQGQVHYYTDRGDLGPTLPAENADAFVADAFSRWTSVSTAALSATRDGRLGEDVNGNNVIANPDGTITMPADTQPTATGTPVGVVYDLDGQVTDALLGEGAGDSLYCFNNSVFGGPDNFSTDGHIAHALVVMNGNCAKSADQLPDMKYHLVRVLGSVFGLDWSQVNPNVITRNPVPTPDDFQGFPLMHFSDMLSCVPVSLCYPNADLPKMDDRAAISRSYPVTGTNLGDFSGKQLFYENTGRIHGSVYFVDSEGRSGQPMQGVNVVARWIDPSTSLPSRKYSAAYVSGALFRGNAGNPVNGSSDSSGQRFDRFGSDDTRVEGFFDLAGLEIPDGSNSAQYQLTVEPVDATWFTGVGSYAPFQVPPSGAATPITVTVSKGGDAQQDLLMQSSTIAQDWGEPESYNAPASLPAGGDWTGSLSFYGDADFFEFSGQAYRTASVAVTALDKNGVPTQDIVRPVVGIWSLSDPAGTLAPAATPSPFNSSTFGLTRLDATLLATREFRIGIADQRGDGRPDYRYHAHVLYANTIAPVRLGMRGGSPLLIQGIGFAPGFSVNVGGANAPVLAVSANEMIVAAPAPALDSVQNVTVRDPVTGSSSTMTDVLTFGAASTDSLRLIQGWNPATSVGGEAPNPIIVGVTTSDGITPVTGATVNWSATSGTQLSACGGASSCAVGSDESGKVWTRAVVTAAVPISVTATLAPASFKTPQKVQATIVGTSSASDITLASQYRWLAAGATTDLPLTARVLTNGLPQSGKMVSYQLVKGSGTLKSNAAVTDANGYAATTIHIHGAAGDVQVSTCVGPSLIPCQTYYFSTVAASALQLEPVSGGGQMITVGQRFQPITLRVTDSATPPHPVQGAAVNLQSVTFRPDNDAPMETVGESGSGDHGTPVILGSSQSTVVSDQNGLASLLPTGTGTNGALEVELTASVGTNSTLQLEVEALWPVAHASQPQGSQGGMLVSRTPGNAAAKGRAARIRSSRQSQVNP